MEAEPWNLASISQLEQLHPILKHELLQNKSQNTKIQRWKPSQL